MATFRAYKKQDGTTSITVRVRVRGVEQTKTFSTKTAAKQWAKSVEVAIVEKPHLARSEAHKHTLSEAIDRYLETVVPGKAEGSQIKDRQRLTWWREHYGHLSLDLLQASTLAEAKDVLLTSPAKRYGTSTTKPKSTATVNRYLAVIAHLLNVAYKEWHWIPTNPSEQVSKFKERNQRTRYLEDRSEQEQPELIRLLKACAISESPDLYLAVMLALVTGGRRNEILMLTWADVDLDPGTVILSGEKTDSRRTVAIPADLLKLLRQRRGTGKTLVFPSPNDPSRPVDLRSAWETSLSRAGISDFRWHDLRHTAASYLAMEGATLADIAGVLGHKTLQMVKRYSHLSPAHIAQTSTLIGKRIASISGQETEQ